MTNEVWTSLSDEELYERVSKVTHQVEFLLLDYYNTKHQDLKGEWMGELTESPFKFKLYRVVNAKDTMEFCVKGRVEERRGKRVIVFKLGFGLSAFFEFLGMFALPFCIPQLLFYRGYHDLEYLGFIGGLAGMAFFVVRLLKRYLKVIDEFQQLIS